MDRVQAEVGNTIQADKWGFPEVLQADDGYKDSGFPGCQFRVVTQSFTIAVNIKVTGKPHWAGCWSGNTWKSRCKIEFVGDCEPSTFTGGWLFHKHNVQ